MRDIPLEAGSLKAIIWDIKNKAPFWCLVDEILHVLDFIPFIANAQWRYRFCVWTQDQWDYDGEE